jgi:branched-chain amino acid aminotransferase
MAALFLVRDGEVITPSVSNDILESINRASVMQLCREVLGLSVTERDVDRTELYAADEVFLCGTGSEIIPVKSVDRYDMASAPGTGPITARLTQLFENVVRGVDERYAEWRTTV